MPSSIEFLNRLRLPYMRSLGLGKVRYPKYTKDNDFQESVKNAAGTDTIPTVGSDALNNLLMGGAVSRPLETPIQLAIASNSKIATVNPIFTNCNDTTPLEVTRIDCIYATAAGSASTGFVSKDVATNAPGAGATCMSGTFNLNTTTNTLQTATLAGPRGWPTLVLNPGDQLTFNVSAVASLAGLVVTVWVRPHTGTSIATWSRHANGDIATSTMYLNLVPGLTVRAVAMRWGTAATNAGAVTMTITKDTGTNAPGAGTAILAAAQSVKGTINTTVYPALTATAATLVMAAGDRLAVKTAGTLTALADLTITVFFNAGPENHIVVPVSYWDTPNTDRTLFIADQHYEVRDFWETWSVASTSVSQLLTKDTGTTAPGAGTALITDNTGAGIDTSATANTPVGSLTLSAVSTKPTLWLAPGDRLGMKDGGAGVVGSLAGVFAAIVLRKV